MFFDSWYNILRILIVGIAAYAGLIIILRLSGNRTLAKLNAFDLVITVALGSVLATILLNKDVTVAEGITALGLLAFLQFSVTWLSIRSKHAAHLIKNEPVLLVRHGKFLDEAMKRARVSREEITQAARSQGRGSIEEIEAVVLETDGTLSLIKHPLKEPLGIRGPYG